MTYENLLKIAGNRLETMDEQLQMLAPADLGGKREYRRIFNLYKKFSETGDMAAFEEIATKLERVTGYRI